MATSALCAATDSATELTPEMTSQHVDIRSGDVSGAGGGVRNNTQIIDSRRQLVYRLEHGATLGMA